MVLPRILLTHFKNFYRLASMFPPAGVVSPVVPDTLSPKNNFAGDPGKTNLQARVTTYPHRWKAIEFGILTLLAYPIALIAWICAGFQNERLKNFMLFEHPRDSWNFAEIKELPAVLDGQGASVATSAPDHGTGSEFTPVKKPELVPETEPAVAEMDPEIEAWKNKISDFLSKLSKSSFGDEPQNWNDKLATWPLPYLRQLKNFLGDITTPSARDRFLVKIPTEIGPYRTTTTTVSPLIKFLNIVSEDCAQFDPAFASLKLALDAKPLVTFANDYSAHFEILAGKEYRSNTMALFEQHPLPLHEKLGTAIAKIFAAEREILKGGVDPKFRAEESVRGAPIHQAYAAAVTGISESVGQLHFYDCIPMTEGDLIEAYNGILENLVSEINQRFSEYGYDEINFDDVKIPLPKTDASPPHLAQSVTTISEGTFFSKIQSALEFAVGFSVSSP
jgi:hypothetical protein